MRRNGLPHALARIRTGAFTIGYLGGSITAGAHASDPEKTSWRALTTAWLRRRFPQVRIAEVSAAVGGTGSELGAFRCATQLLPADPALVLIEFAVNDATASADRILRGMEGIVRRLRHDGAALDLVVVFTTSRTLATVCDQGEIPASIRAHERIAEHYGLPSINAGALLLQRVKSDALSFHAALPDGTHPGDLGHAIYADAVIHGLNALLALAQETPSVAIGLPPPLACHPFSNGKLIGLESATGEGWQRTEMRVEGKPVQVLECAECDCPLHLEFYGNVIGFTWIVAPDSGALWWSVDHGETHALTSWDRYAATLTRLHYALLMTDLGPGKHLLQLSVQPQLPAGSAGRWIRLVNFLTHSAEENVSP